MGIFVGQSIQILTMLFILCSAAQATSLDAAEPTPPDVVVRETSEQLLTRLRAEADLLEQDTTRLYGLIEYYLVPQVDLMLMSRWVLGRHWRNATEEQREAFALAFKQMLIRFYATSLLEYQHFELRFLPLQLKPGTRQAVVRSEFIRKSGQGPINVDFYMALREGRWRAYDVNIDGISVVTNYRASFAKTIQEEGLDALIERLRQWQKTEGAEKNP